MSADIVKEEQSALPPAARPDVIEARAGRYYRNARYIIVAAMFVCGFLFIRDGFYRYPAANKAAIEAGRPLDKLPHPGWDVPLQKLIGVTLAPLGLFLLVWMLYRSRGAYRLAGTTLHIPGHPPIPLDSIRRIDKRLWARKGIACLEYELAGRKSPGRFKLDDFVYQREPTDQILEAVEAYLTSGQELGK